MTENYDKYPENKNQHYGTILKDYMFNHNGYVPQPRVLKKLETDFLPENNYTV